MSYLGDFAAGQVVRTRINTYATTGAPITLVGGTLGAYKDAGGTESLLGLTLVTDFDARTGLHLVMVDTSADAFYAAGSDFDVVLTAGTVDSVSVVGTVVASFSIANRSATLATAEASGTPAATSTPQSRLGYLFKLARNKTLVTASGIAVRNDGDSADSVTATHSESGGTYTRNKFS